MKLHEVTQDELRVEKDTGTEVHLKNTKNGVKTIIPTSHNKKGSITQDEKGEYVVDPDAGHGKVDKLQVGSKVKVKQNNNQNNSQSNSNANKKQGTFTGGKNAQGSIL